jgi:hypothetical protein
LGFGFIGKPRDHDQTPLTVFSFSKRLKLPELTARAGTIDEIPEAVRAAAAAHTGRAPEDFDVQVDY